MRGSVVLFLSLMLAVVGCTHDAPKEPAPPAPAGWPLSLESFSFVWTAGPGIDLVTDGAAIASRAYVESIYLACITESEKFLYPGFADAVESNEPGGRPETTNYIRNSASRSQTSISAPSASMC